MDRLRELDSALSEPPVPWAAKGRAFVAHVYEFFVCTTVSSGYLHPCFVQ